MESEILLLRKQHIKITPQRLEVYKLLKKKCEHLTAEEIYAQISRRFPIISLATIYSILEVFKKKNLVQEIRIKFDKSCFDIKIDTHHHFFCRVCEKIFDVYTHPCSALQNKEVEGHLIEHLQGYFYGVCNKCKGSKKAKT